MSEKDTDEVEQHMNWNAIAEGLKLHENIHDVVIYDIPKDIDITDPKIIESIKEINRLYRTGCHLSYNSIEMKSNQGRTSLHHRIQQISRRIKHLDRKRLQHQL